VNPSPEAFYDYNLFAMDNASKRIRSSRERKNLLKVAEFRIIELLCRIMPKWVNPDMLTTTGILGSVIIALGLILAIQNPFFLFLSVAGFAIQWFGDSLDGRLAYFRNIPRKWYGWALDINADWISASIIGIGFYFYFEDWKIIAFLFILAYGGAMILSLIRYKIANKYVIDTHSLGPTELRIIISIFLIAEIFLPGALWIFALIGSLLLMLINVYDSFEIFKLGDQRDMAEKSQKSLIT
jgi:phosphatidylglycerophosphate synthase